MTMTPEARLGRLTARGGERVEAEIRAIVLRAGELLQEKIDRRAYRSVLLIGGYGRGEGGVERLHGSEDSERVERPHNNLDFLVIAAPGPRGAEATLKKKIDDLLRPLAEEHGIGMDVGVVGEWRLRASPCLVMWYDMRFGHKVVAGDPYLVPSLTRFRRDAIDVADVRDLLINRGTLLVINDVLLARSADALGEADRKTIIKHAMKAVIGYGDAYLFSVGEYDASYAEKQRRMRELRDVPSSLRAIYDEAIEFRFEPSYDGYLNRNLGAWMNHLREELARVHLSFEAARLGVPALSWSDYPDRALRHALFDAPLSLRALARKGKNLARGLRNGAPSTGGDLLTDLAMRCAGPRSHLALAFPAVLYGGEVGAPYAELARRVLGAEDTSPAELRRAYLARWGDHGDINFANAAARIGLPLSPSPFHSPSSSRRTSTSTERAA